MKSGKVPIGPAAELGREERCEEPGAYPHRDDEVEQSERRPCDAEAVRSRETARERERHERRGEADRDVAPARRLREMGGNLPGGQQHEEDEADDR